MDHAPMPPSAGRVFQLTPSSVSPTRTAARDKNGFVREETICALAKHERFVDLRGNICTVPLQSGRVLSQDSDAERYEQIQRKDQIMAGCLPLAECPFTQEYRRWTGTTTLVEMEAGDVPCDGAPEGCEHLKPIIERRRVFARQEWESQQAQTASLTQAQAESLVKTMAQALGTGLASQLADAANDPRAQARANMRAGKGERDEK